MQKNDLLIQTFLELFQFQEPWNVDWSSRMPNKNQAEKLNQSVSSKSD